MESASNHGRRAVWPLGAVLAVGLLALGSVTHPTLAATFGLAVLGFIWTVTAVGPVKRSTPNLIAAVALWGAAAVTVLQLVPLPLGLLERLSPNAAAVWRETRVLLGVSLTHAPLTMDPAGTAVAAATALSCALTFEIASRVSVVSRTSRRDAVIAVSCALLALAVITIAHRAFGVTEVYGRYRTPSDTPLVSPLMNANHAAAALAALPPLLLGLGLEAEEVEQRWLAYVAAALSTALTILTLSRGGIAVVALEWAAVAAYLALSERGGSSRRRNVLTVALAMVCAVAAALTMSRDRVLLEAKDTNVEKLRVFADAAKLARENAWFGVGRGAFGPAFGPFQPEGGGNAIYSHAENWPVHLAAEFGMPVTIALVGAIAYALFAALRIARPRPSVVGALIALAGLALHDLADFSLEYVGVGAIGAALLGVVTSRGSARTHRAAFSLAPIIAAIVVGAVGASLLWSHWRRALEDEYRDVQALEWKPGPALEARARSAMLRHPGDAFFPMLVGAARLREADAHRFLTRSVTRGPGRGVPHVWLGRYFLMRGMRGQAWAEYREAVRLFPSLQRVVTADMLAGGAPVAEFEALQVDENAFDEVSLSLSKSGRDLDADTLDETIAARFRPAMRARLRRIARAVHGGEAATARSRAADLLALAPDEPEAVRTVAELEADDLKAESILEQALSRLDKKATLLEALCLRRGARLGLPAVAAEFERFEQALVVEGLPLDRPDAIRAEICLRRHEDAAAITHLIRAAQRSMAPTPHLLKAAALAEATHQLPLALSLYLRLEQLNPEQQTYAPAIGRVRSAIFAK